MLRLGLIGGGLSHSYSPMIYSQMIDCTYNLFPLTRAELPEFMENFNLDGVNVTIPYKQEIIPFLEEVCGAAAEIGAVNTIVKRDGKLYGYNTDVDGFSFMCSLSGAHFSGKKALILGSGGACKTAVSVLAKLGAYVTVISRNGADNYDNIAKHSDAQIIVNTTPVGMYPQTGYSPIDLDIFKQCECVLDLVYNPARTALTMQAQRMGIKAMTGLSMLVAQAKRAAELYTGSEIDEQVTQKVLSSLSRHMLNIVLVGMPGSGKSTVGKLLASMLGREFFDCDEEIEKRYGASPKEIITQQGESEFRRIETAVLSTLGAMSEAVIATGGGAVTQPENYDLLRQNSVIYCINRPLELLSTNGRPLSGDVKALYEVRRPMYEAFADRFADNVKTAAHTAREIAEDFIV